MLSLLFKPVGFAVVLDVNLEDVVASAVEVTGHGEDLAAGHRQTDSRIAAAAAGWQGNSAAALTARLDRWALTSSALLGRISGHAEGLHDAASGFATLEEQRAQVMRAVAVAADQATTE